MSKEEQREAKLQQLRDALKIGEESGEDVDFSMEELIAALPTSCIKHGLRRQTPDLTRLPPENGCGGS